MSTVYDIVCRNTAAHPPRTIATVTDLEALDTWTCTPQASDLSGARRPRDGYRFACRCGEHVACHRGDLHHALHRLGQEGRRVITLHGIRYLRRLEHDPVRPPQPLEPLADARGFLMHEGTRP